LIDSSEKETRRIIESLKGSGKVIAVVGGDDAFNRRAAESLKINYLVLQKGRQKDGLKQRDSGINHVVAKIAKEKGIDLDGELLKRDVLRKPNKSFRKKMEEEMFKKMFDDEEVDKKK